jgi:hypothetical protein
MAIGRYSQGGESVEHQAKRGYSITGGFGPRLIAVKPRQRSKRADVREPTEDPERLVLVIVEKMTARVITVSALRRRPKHIKSGSI